MNTLTINAPEKVAHAIQVESGPLVDLVQALPYRERKDFTLAVDAWNESIDDIIENL